MNERETSPGGNKIKTSGELAVEGRSPWLEERGYEPPVFGNEKRDGRPVTSVECTRSPENSYRPERPAVDRNTPSTVTQRGQIRREEETQVIKSDKKGSVLRKCKFAAPLIPITAGLATGWVNFVAVEKSISAFISSGNFILSGILISLGCLVAYRSLKSK